MASATFSSDDIERLDAVLAGIDSDYGIATQLVRIDGKRWSYEAGRSGSSVPVLPFVRWQLSADLGLVVYSDKSINCEMRQDIVDRVQQCIQQTTEQA